MTKTLWERWTTKPAPEPERWNPLKARVGAIITLNLAEHADILYRVQALREVILDQRGHKNADYDIGDMDNKARIRCCPTQDGYQTILLERYDDLPFDAGLLETCKESQEFHVTEDNEESTYWRVGDAKEPFHCLMQVHEGGAWNQCKVDVWDYSRITLDEAGQQFEQFLFVEMDKDSGRFQLWRGEEIEPSRITVG